MSAIYRTIRGSFARPTIPIAAPRSTYWTIRGDLYVVETWTREEWERLPERDRPAGAQPHGDGWAILRPS
jgi:hypothetical protein